jgi:hypothetical protein
MWRALALSLARVQTKEDPHTLASLRSAAPSSWGLGIYDQRRTLSLVSRQKKFDALAVAAKRFPAIKPVHGSIERLVRPAQICGHRRRVVEVCEVAGIEEIGRNCAD